METEKGEDGPVRARQRLGRRGLRSAGGSGRSEVRRVWAGQKGPGRRGFSGAVNVERL